MSQEQKKSRHSDRFAMRGDREWDELVAFVLAWCKQHECTLAAFIRHFNFPRGYARFLYYEKPSPREGTQGREFRDALKRIKMESEVATGEKTVKDTVMDRAQNEYLSNLEKWRSEGVGVSFDPDKIIVKVATKSPGRGKFPKFVSQLSEAAKATDPHALIPEVAETPIELYTTIGLEDAEQIKVGTAGLLHYDYALGLTAAHNLTKEIPQWKSEPVMEVLRCIKPASEKIEDWEPFGIFSETCFHPEVDVAFFLFLNHFSLELNKIPNIGNPILDHDVTPECGMLVQKVGHATGFTVGRIVRVADEEFVVTGLVSNQAGEVKTDAVETPFGDHGDSGALVFMDRHLLGVLIGGRQEDKRAHIVRWDYFKEWLLGAVPATQCGA